VTRGRAGRGSLLQRRERETAISGPWVGVASPIARQQPVGARVGSSHIRLWIGLVLAAVVVGTLGYVVIEGWPPLDALYMTVITVTTVGYREVGALGAAGRVWTMLLAVVGVGLLFGFVGVVAESLVGEATSGKREARRMARAVEALSGHFVLCGYGRVGSTVARELRHDGEDVVVIDVLPESLRRAHDEGFLVVAGDATDDSTLRAAGIERARGLITTVDSDANNVYVILSARAINPSLFVVGRANAAGAEARLMQAGADRVVSPYTMAGHRIAGLAMRPRVVDYIDAALSHGELAFSLEEVTAREGDSIAGRTVGELREDGVFTLAIVPPTGGYAANPRPERRIVAGEVLVVSGSAATLAVLRDG
jgi:voltage-gated potassium channel